MKRHFSKKETMKWQMELALKILHLERQRGTEKVVSALKQKLDESFTTINKLSE